MLIAFHFNIFIFAAHFAAVTPESPNCGTNNGLLNWIANYQSCPILVDVPLLISSVCDLQHALSWFATKCAKWLG